MARQPRKGGSGKSTRKPRGKTTGGRAAVYTAYRYICNFIITQGERLTEALTAGGIRPLAAKARCKGRSLYRGNEHDRVYEFIACKTKAKKIKRHLLPSYLPCCRSYARKLQGICLQLSTSLWCFSLCFRLYQGARVALLRSPILPSIK